MLQRPRRASLQVEPLAQATLAPFMTAREAPRVPFTALIERGMIKPGEALFDAKRKVKALVRADGAVSLGDTVGSIHRIGALAQGLDACNGWAFWHVERDRKLTLIDGFRAEVARSDGGRRGVSGPDRAAPIFSQDCCLLGTALRAECSSTLPDVLRSARPHPGSATSCSKFDRAAEDLGNSIHLEHVNVQIPDQRLAQLFYAVGPRADARSLPDGVRHQHVGQCRAQPVPPADRQGAGAARPHRPR